MTLYKTLNKVAIQVWLLESRIRELENTLHDCADVLDNYSESEDGDDGVPVPNRAMAMRTKVLRILTED
jgi:hypothetical protein